MPPPKAKGSIKNRSRRSEESISNLSDCGRKAAGFENEFGTMATEADNTPINVKSIPDITLSQLLTLGIDDLASKLNVPSSKLNTMTIVELTKYLSDYIEKSSQKSVNLSEPSVTETTVPVTTQPPSLEKASESSAVFRVSFDDSNDSTFVAKFDDNFGLDNEDFIPNFDKFNQTTHHHNTTSTIDKYAVFREIIDQELQETEITQQHTQESKPSDESNEISSDAESPINEMMMVMDTPPISSKIDTKITEVISQAKDRYAALRDIILVEDLFEKPSSTTAETPVDERTENLDTSNTLNDDTGKDDEEEYVAVQSSPDANISINLEDHDELDPLKTTTPTKPILGSKDDLEIDEYMNRAISNLSLDSRDHLSPLSKSVTKSQNASTSPLSLQYKKSSPIASIIDEETATVEEVGSNKSTIRKANLNDMSTSPIPIQIVSMAKPATPDLSSFSTAKSQTSIAPLSTADDNLQPNQQVIITTPSPILKNDSSKSNTNYGKENSRFL